VADKVQAVTHDEDVDPNEEELFDETRWRCIVCGRTDQEDVLLLCDNCNDAYHTYCLSLDAIPEGDWFCPNCINFSQIHFIRPSTAPRDHARTAMETHSRGRERTSRRRQLQQQQQWARAWARLRDRAWEALDADVRADEERAPSAERGLTRHQHEERLRWITRLSHSPTSGAAYLRSTQSESGHSGGARGDTPPAAAMSDPEEDRAWNLFDEARSSVERAAKRPRRSTMTASTSREDTPTTAGGQTPKTPVRSPPTQTRRLKRPRTSRVTPPSKEAAPSVQVASAVTPVMNRRTSTVATTDDSSGGTFLQSLLSDINRPKSPQTPLDLSTALTPAARALLFGPSPPHSPPLPATPPNTSDSPASLSESLSPLEGPLPSPTRRASSPSFAVKSHIQYLVSQALKPHYRTGRLSRDEFTEVNKTICRRLYDVVERGEAVDGLVHGEVRRELESRGIPMLEELTVSSS